MIRLGLRLALYGGREVVFRLLVTAAAVAVGTALLLLTLAGINAVNAQNARYTWLNVGYVRASPTAGSGRAHVDPAWWQLTPDTFDGRTIGRVDVAVTGPDSPVPPGLGRLPGPGQIYVSPAMRRLLASTPAAQLADRYPGRLVGVIGAAGLPAPTSLLIVVGHTPAELDHAPHATEVTGFARAAPGDCGCYSLGFDSNGIDLILSIVAVALLFPVLIFVGSATRLAAARREQRFAAMRLVGATPRQISTISAVESGAAAVLGVIVGFALFVPLRAPVATIPFTGDPFFTNDLTLNLPDVIAVAVGIPLAAVIAARLALRRVQISPLGVSRRVPPKPPRAYRLVPLLAGALELGFFVVIGHPHTTDGQLAAYLGGILVIMAGLIIAGPWFTMLGARFISRRTSRPEVLLAGRRLADNPQAAFRAISGVILALFVTTVAVGVITTIVHFQGRPRGGALSSRTVIDDFSGTDPRAARPAYSPALVRELAAITGVTAISTIHVDPDPGASNPDQPTAGVIDCTELTGTPFLGHCPSGASSAVIEGDFYGPDLGPDTTQAHTTWPGASYSTGAVAKLAVQTVVVSTDGSRAAVEQSRSSLERAYPLQAFPPGTPDEDRIQNAKQLAEFEQLADVVILTSLPIAGCSLAVSVSAGLTDRKRPFSLLRLAGAPIGVLRRVVAFESVVPLSLGALVAIGSGFGAAALFLRSQLDYPLQPPHATYYVIVALGLVVSLAVVASTLPLLARLTGPETARND